MKHWETTLIPKSASVRDATQTLDTSMIKIVLIVDEKRHLLGTVTDGDIRRGTLKGVTLDESVKSIMNTHPIVAGKEEPHQAVYALMKKEYLRHIPILDERGIVVGIETLNDVIDPPLQDNWVVLMAGGLGYRLRPLTEACPKPMLRVGGKPVLETIIENFIAYGFHRFYLSVNYKAEVIENYFSDGSRWNVDIRYLHETDRMGTAGALSLLPQVPTHPILVMNGDLLTKVNFKQLLEFHIQQQAQATMCIRENDFKVPYGVVKIDDNQFVSLDEKPVQHFFVNAGIYVLNPCALALIPESIYFDMPWLFEKLRQKNQKTLVFPVREYWIDIGHTDDLQRANGEFLEVFV